MNHIILQPTGNKDAREHYNDTIENPVRIERIKKYVDTTIYENILELYPDGNIYIWGVTNGANDANKHKWEKIKKGDVTLFSQDGMIFRTAITTMAFHNKSLANYLWGVNDKGETWENIYLVDDIKALNISYKQFNKIVGYDEKYIIQGFNVLDDLKSEKLFNKLDLYSDVIPADITEQEYEKEIKRLMNEENLDKASQGTSRKEQSYLRKIMFNGKKIATCGICGREMPVELLVTAHIKKRSDCTKEERLDVSNIVMPMCKLGCDDLYEKGYILVREGKIERNRSKFESLAVTNYLNGVVGMKCTAWNERTSEYFEQHNSKFKAN